MKHINYDNISDLISVIPLAIYISLIYILIVTKEIIYFKMIFIILLSTILTDIIKRLPYKSFYNGEYLYKITRRPNGSCNCDYLSKTGECGDEANGFPSGHMSSITSFSIIMVLFYMNVYNLTFYELLLQKPTIPFISSLLIVSMGWSRHLKKCHSVLQIVTGIVLGSVVTILIY